MGKKMSDCRSASVGLLSCLRIPCIMYYVENQIVPTQLFYLET